MKLRLDLTELRVESFATASGSDSNGTVFGHLVPPSEPEGTCHRTCTPLYSQPDTCQWTCNDDTCGSCNTGPNDPGCNPPPTPPTPPVPYTGNTSCYCVIDPL